MSPNGWGTVNGLSEDNSVVIYFVQGAAEDISIGFSFGGSSNFAVGRARLALLGVFLTWA